MVTNRRLKHLIVLAAHRHFGRAAQALHITQPALTKSIQALEAELDVTLLDRTRGAVELTAYGELVVQRGKSLLAAEENLRRDIAHLAEHATGSLRVAIGPYMAVMCAFSAAANFVATHPAIKLGLWVGGWREVLQQVSNEVVDFGIVELSGVSQHRTLITEIIGEQDCHFFCGPHHPLLSQPMVALAQLTEFPWVSSRIPGRISAHFPDNLGRAGTIDPATGDMIPAIEMDCPLQAPEFLGPSDTIAVSTLTAMEAALEHGQVIALPVEASILKTHYGFVFREGHSLPPTAITFMQEVRASEQLARQHEAALAARWLGPPGAYLYRSPA